MAFQKVARDDELWSGEMIGACVSGTKLLLVRVDDTIYAYEDRCAHLGVKLSEGTLEGHKLICKVHHWEYDVCRGKGLNPETAKMRSFPVKVENGDVYVDVESGSDETKG